MRLDPWILRCDGSECKGTWYPRPGLRRALLLRRQRCVCYTTGAWSPRWESHPHFNLRRVACDLLHYRESINLDHAGRPATAFIRASCHARIFGAWLNHRWRRWTFRSEVPLKGVVGNSTQNVMSSL